MRFSFFLLLIVGSCTCLLAQTAQIAKPKIDTGAFNHWPNFEYTGGATLSPLGHYVEYGQQRIFSEETPTLVLQNTAGSWKKEYQGVYRCSFSADERQAYFQKADSLHFVKLGSGEPDQVIAVRSSGSPYPDRGEWLTYQIKDGQLILLNLISRMERNLGPTSAYVFGKEGDILLFTKKDSTVSELQYMEVNTSKVQSIWKGSSKAQTGDFNFDKNAQQLSFTVTENIGGSNIRSIWYYRFGVEKPKLLLQDNDPRIPAGLTLSGSATFSGNGHWLFLTLIQAAQALPKPKPDPAAIKVDVWGYKDRYLQPDQLGEEGDGTKRFTAVISVTGNNFRRLEYGEQHLTLSPKELSGDFAVISSQDSTGHADHIAAFAYQLNYYILSLKDGNCKLLKKDVASLYPHSQSLDGRWLVYYDWRNCNYYSYDTQTGKSHNLTGLLPVKFNADYSGDLTKPPVGEIAGWLKGNNAILIYDNYDLWAIDPSGRRPAVNITNGYGAKNHVKLRLISDESPSEKPAWAIDDTLLFTGFNTSNKYNGFYRQVLGKKSDPEQLCSGPYSFYLTPSQGANGFDYDNGMAPVKASKANCWIVKRQSAEEAPNYFLSNDLKTFSPLTHLAPQKAYNWLKAELITWKQLDGTKGQGILYKPENFDPNKKYPVIFNYYEQLTQRIYQFPEPGVTENDINVPWFVSRGYLVFTPDIQYQAANLSGKTAGAWAYNSVVSAAQYLAKLPYIDSNRMGLQGHSFGGAETNYLVTHSHLFAAAAEAAGVSDAVSSYLSLTNAPAENNDQLVYYENGQGRYGATPWQRPDLYRQASTVLDADQITTPLLIMHNKLDGAVPYRQGIELYMALRRLEKPVWLLQYDEGRHSVYGKDALDYTIRLTQFFDYYLKGLPPPVWMTQGVSARLKGIQTGFQLDTSGAKP